MSHALLQNLSCCNWRTTWEYRLSLARILFASSVLSMRVQLPVVPGIFLFQLSQTCSCLDLLGRVPRGRVSCSCLVIWCGSWRQCYTPCNQPSLVANHLKSTETLIAWICALCDMSYTCLILSLPCTSLAIGFFESTFWITWCRVICDFRFLWTCSVLLNVGSHSKLRS